MEWNKWLSYQLIYGNIHGGHSAFIVLMLQLRNINLKNIE